MSNNLYIPEHLDADLKLLCNDINNQDQVYEAMIRTTTKSMIKIKLQGIYDLLRKLRSNDVGTNEVEHGLVKLCKLWSNKQKLQLKRKMMRHKISDAYNRYKEAEYESNVVWRQCKTIIPLSIRNSFNLLWKTFISGYRKQVRERYNKKVEWLKQKWTPEVEVPPAEYNNIKLTFNQLGNEFTSQPRVYDEVAINQNEKELLSLPPNFGMYTKIKPVDCVIDCEKALTKLRWHKHGVNNNNSTSTMAVNRKDFFDKSRNEFDINQLKATDLPYNPSVMMPKATDIESEVKYQQFKNEVRDIATDISSKTQKLSNLSKSEREGLKSINERIKKKKWCAIKLIRVVDGAVIH